MSLANDALERAEKLKGLLPFSEDKHSPPIPSAPKLSPVPENAAVNITVRATAAANRGREESHVNIHLILNL